MGDGVETEIRHFTVDPTKLKVAMKEILTNVLVSLSFSLILSFQLSADALELLEAEVRDRRRRRAERKLRAAGLPVPPEEVSRESFEEMQRRLPFSQEFPLAATLAGVADVERELFSLKEAVPHPEDLDSSSRGRGANDGDLHTFTRVRNFRVAGRHTFASMFAVLRTRLRGDDALDLVVAEALVIALHMCNENVSGDSCDNFSLAGPRPPSGTPLSACRRGRSLDGGAAFPEQGEGKALISLYPSLCLLDSRINMIESDGRGARGGEGGPCQKSAQSSSIHGQVMASVKETLREESGVCREPSVDSSL